MEPVIVTVASTLFIAGVAYGATWKAVKTTLNGTKDEVKETRRDVKEIRDSLRAHVTEEANNDQVTHERIAVVETKIDILSERIK